MNYLYNLTDIPVYCCETAFHLFDLDENTIAYYQSIDPNGVILERHLAMGYRHPAIRTIKDGYFHLADCYPTLFLCWLMHKFITLPADQFPLESYDNLCARASISRQLCELYESDRIDDVLFQDIISTLQVVPLLDSNKTTLTIPLKEPAIALTDIQFLLERVRSANSKMSGKDVATAISQFRLEEAKHKASPLLYLYWNQSTSGDYKDSPKAHIRKEVNRRIRQISALDLLDPFGIDGTRFLLEAAKKDLSPEAKAKAGVASDALAALASMLAKKNNS